MRLVLFRHGPAGDRDPAEWPNDALRPLTDKGRDRTRAAARGVLALERRVAAVLTSPLVRADETAQILASEASLGEVTTIEALSPGGSWREAIAAIAGHTSESGLGERDVLVVVGHEPDLGKLAGVLLFGAPRSLPLKKAGACALSFDGPPAAGAGTLRWFLGPRALRGIASRRKGTP